MIEEKETGEIRDCTHGPESSISLVEVTKRTMVSHFIFYLSYLDLKKLLMFFRIFFWDELARSPVVSLLVSGWSRTSCTFSMWSDCALLFLTWFTVIWDVFSNIFVISWLSFPPKATALYGFWSVPFLLGAFYICKR